MSKKDQVSEETALVAQSRAVMNYAAEFEEDAEVGTNFDLNELVIPYFSIVQSNSPQLKRKNEKYIEGIELGDIFNTKDGTFVKGEEGFYFVNAGKDKKVVEWVPKEEGGGFVANHPVNAPIVAKARANSWKLNGHVFKETVYYPGFALWPDADSDELVWITGQISMASTQLKAARAFNTLVQNAKLPRSSGTGFFTPPVYSQIFRFKTKDENNNKGQDWKGWEISLVGTLDMRDSAQASVFKQAKAVYNLIQEGAFSFGPPPAASDDTAEELPFG